LNVGLNAGTRIDRRAFLQQRAAKRGAQGGARVQGVAQMLLNESKRLNRNARERIRYLLRSFYNRLLVEPVPDRVLVTIKAEERAPHSSGLRVGRNADNHSS